MGKDKITKVTETVSALASFLDSGHEVGTNFNIAELTKKAEIKHPDTTRSKITEGFIWKKVLDGWEEAEREDGMVRLVKKVDTKQIDLETIMAQLRKIQEDIKKLK